MRKQILFLLLGLVSTQAVAYRITDTDEVEFDLKGSVSYAIKKEDGEEFNQTKIEDSGSYLSLEFKNKFTEKFSVKAVIKANVNLSYKLFDDQKEFDFASKSLVNKHSASDDSVFISYNSGYLTVNHSDGGSLSFGKKEGVYSEYVLSKDVFRERSNVYGSSVVFDGSYSGTGRSDSVIQYHNNIGNLNFALQYQLDRTSFEGSADSPISKYNYSNGYSFATSYSVNNMLQVAVGANYHSLVVNYNDTINSEQKYNSYISGLRLTYNHLFKPGVFGSARLSYGVNHGKTFHGQFLAPKAIAADASIGYSFDSTKFYLGGYYSLISKKDSLLYSVEKGDSGNSKPQTIDLGIDSYSFTNASVGFSHDIKPNFTVFAEYSLLLNVSDNIKSLSSEMAKSIEDNINKANGFSIGAIYNF